MNSIAVVLAPIRGLHTLEPTPGSPLHIAFGRFFLRTVCLENVQGAISTIFGSTFGVRGRIRWWWVPPRWVVDGCARLRACSSLACITLEGSGTILARAAQLTFPFERPASHKFFQLAASRGIYGHRRMCKAIWALLHQTLAAPICCLVFMVRVYTR